ALAGWKGINFTKEEIQKLKNERNSVWFSTH
ncbi:MAG: hypothetical protein RL582_14, partial [Bacteroidota bacterium]